MNLLAAFPKSVAVEFKKSRHKHSLLLLAIAVLLNYFYLFHGNTPDRQAWYNVFFAIPMINTDSVCPDGCPCQSVGGHGTQR